VYYVYILKDNSNKFYTGYCSNLKKRLEEHSDGKVFATRTNLPIKLVYYEACLNKYDAVKREKYLKSGPGKKFLNQRLKNYLNNQ